MRKCTIHVAKTKALISFAVTAKLICVFVFAYADCWFSHGAAHFLSRTQPNFSRFETLDHSPGIGCFLRDIERHAPLCSLSA